MSITMQMSDETVLSELGARLRRHRLALDLSQKDLAHEAGVSKRTLERVEAGRSTQTDSLLRVLRALGLIENLDAVVPQPLPSPRTEARKQRASGRSEDDAPWTWGDE